MEQELRSAFEAADMDKSGRIDRYEFTRSLLLLDPSSSSGLGDEVIGELFDAADINSDGMLSFREFKDAVLRQEGVVIPGEEEDDEEGHHREKEERLYSSSSSSSSSFVTKTSSSFVTKTNDDVFHKMARHVEDKAKRKLARVAITALPAVAGFVVNLPIFALAEVLGRRMGTTEDGDIR